MTTESLGESSAVLKGDLLVVLMVPWMVAKRVVLMEPQRVAKRVGLMEPQRVGTRVGV